MFVRFPAIAFKHLRLAIITLVLAPGALATQGCSQHEQALTVNPQFGLRLVSDTALAPMADRLLASYENRHPDMLFTLSYLNRSAVLDSIQSGEADVALLFHPLADREFFSTPIGYAPLIIITNENGEMTSLSREQLRALFAGQLSELGRQVIAREPGSSEQAAFDALVMGGQPTASTVQIALTPETMIAAVQSSADAIGYVSGTFSSSGVSIVSIDGAAPTDEAIMSGQYPLMTQVIFVSARDPRGVLHEFLDWILSQRGQLTVDEYLVPLQY